MKKKSKQQTKKNCKPTNSKTKNLNAKDNRNNKLVRMTNQSIKIYNLHPSQLSNTKINHKQSNNQVRIDLIENQMSKQ